ncbi:MAG: glycosyltransferase [bacterium]|nr:glycosyltransferase [bacterium]
MKIIYVENVRMPSERAHAYQIVQMCANWAKQGHEVVLVTPRRAYRQSVFDYFHLPPDAFSHIPLSVIDPLSWTWFPWKRLAYVLQRASFFFSLRRWTKGMAADVWYTRDAALVEELFGADATRKFVLELHDDPERLRLRLNNIASAMLGYVAITRALKQELLALGIEEQSVIVAPDGYDPTDFTVAGDRGLIRKVWGVPEDAFVLLYVGGLFAWKGVDLAVASWAGMSEQAHLVVVGGAKTDQDRLRALVHPSVRERVHFIDAVPHEEAVRFYAGADAGLLSGSSEDAHSRLFTSPLKLFEYLAAGLPIFAADLPSSREILTERVSKFYPASETGFRAAFQDFLRDSAWRTAARSGAPSFVAPFAWGVRAQEVALWMAQRCHFALENGYANLRQMITFVFPAYNEAENIKRFPSEVFPVFDALGVSYEIVLVDDGSSDQTFIEASKLGSRVRVIQHPTNLGLGAAVRTGIREAKGDLVITMDTDLTFAPALVVNLLERFKKGDVDVVSGSPKLAGYGSDIPSYRVFISHVANFVYRIVMGARVTAVSPIFRLYKREQVASLPLQSTRFDINAEILFYLIRDRRRIAEIPTELTQRKFGESKLDYKKEMRRHFYLIVRILWMRVSSFFKGCL